MTNFINKVDMKYWYLKNHELFKSLSEKEVENLCIMSNFMEAYKDETIYFNKSVKRIYILKKGLIKIIGTDSVTGEEVIKDVIEEGDLFGEIGLQIDNIADDDVAKVASPNMSACSFLVSDFENLIKMKPDLGLTYTKWVGFKLKKLSNKYSDLMFKDVKSRLKSFISNQAEISGKQNEMGVVYKNYLTQKEIAQLIGASRQTVTSLFSELEKEGFITYDRSTITLIK
jgi:CRP-like cAMP-binding protein